MKPDEDLKALFDRQRRREAERAPAFARLLEPSRPRVGTRSLAPVYAFTAALLVIVGGWWGFTHWPAADLVSLAQAKSPGQTTWRVASDFLLEVPGQEFLGEPNFEEAVGSLGVRRKVLDLGEGTSWLAAGAYHPALANPAPDNPGSDRRLQRPENTNTTEERGYDS